VEFKLDKKNDSFATLTVNIAEGDYQAQFDQRVKEYGKQVRIKGFRPGKVPAGIIKNMAGESLLADEIFKILSSEVNQYIKANDVQLIGEPLPSVVENTIDFKTQKVFEFQYDLGLIPNYQLNFSDALTFKKHEVSIDGPTLNETIEGLKKQFASTDSLDSVGDDSLLTGEIEINETSKTISFSTDQLLKKEFSNFSGKKISDEITFDIDQIFKKGGKETIVGISKEEINDLTGEFTLKLTSISSQKEAELNQEFFDKVLGPGKAEKEEDFLKELKVILTSNYNKDADAYLFNKIREFLVENTTISLSEEFLLRWILESNKEQGLKEEDVKKDMGNYLKEFKWSIIKGKIATEAKIKVEQDEVKSKAIDNMAAQFFGGQDIPDEMKESLNGYVDKYLKDDNNKNYYNTFEQILAEKLFEHIKTVVKIEAKPIDASVFKKQIESK
jgi:trigger factor